MTKIKLDYFGFPGEGPTVKEARANASAKLQAFLHEEEGMLICRHPQIPTVFILWREPQGWGYRSFPEKANGAFCQRFTHCTCLGPIEEKEARCRVLSHLAGLTQDAAVARQLLPDNFEWQSWRRRQAFQLAHKAAPADCTTETLRHQWACEHDREFINQVPA